MDAKLILTFSGGVFLALFILRSRARGRGGQMIDRPVKLPAVRSTFGRVVRGGVTVALGEEVLELLTAGRRDEALRLARERTGMSAAEAEVAIRRYETFKGRLGL